MATTRRDEKSLQWVDKSDIGPYSGSWRIGEPDLKNGECAVLNSQTDADNWALEVCETLLPYMCQMPACPKDTFQCFGEMKCINNNQVCDGKIDCSSRSDEFDCPGSNLCTFRLSGSTGSFTSVNYPKPYPRNYSCLWLIETPVGTRVDVQFDKQFSTEDGKDLVTVLGGSPLPLKGEPLATLSGHDIPVAHFRSGSNFLVVKFVSDFSVEMSGFSATWTSVVPECGGDLTAKEKFETVRVLSSKQEPLGEVECVFRVLGPVGSVVTIELLELVLQEPSEVVRIRNGGTAKGHVLATMDARSGLNETIFQATSSDLYVYLRMTGISSIGFRYGSGCDMELGNYTGNIKSPGFDIGVPYPRNLACSWRIKPVNGGPFIIQVICDCGHPR